MKPSEFVARKAPTEKELTPGVAIQNGQKPQDITELEGNMDAVALAKHVMPRPIPQHKPTIF